jgi:hypothetical protein
MPGTQWIEDFANSSYNSALAAAAVETITDTKHNKEKFGPFNRLLVSNRDAVDIKIQFNGLSTEGRIIEIPAGGTFLLEPEDGVTFDFITQTNLDSAVAESASKILFRWAKAREKK